MADAPRTPSEMDGRTKEEWFVLDDVTGDTHVFPSQAWAEQWAAAHPWQGCVRKVHRIVTHSREVRRPPAVSPRPIGGSR